MNTNNSRQIISQSHAARLKGVSRQRINELVKRGRFTVPTDNKGAEMKGSLYLDEIINFEEGTRGRPRKSQENWFTIGQQVLWNLEPRGGYGFVVPIVATVEKTSNKKIQLKFIGGDREEHLAWVDRDCCLAMDDTASDNERTERLAVLDELTKQAQELNMGY